MKMMTILDGPLKSVHSVAWFDWEDFCGTLNDCRLEDQPAVCSATRIQRLGDLGRRSCLACMPCLYLIMESRLISEGLELESEQNIS